MGGHQNSEIISENACILQSVYYIIYCKYTQLHLKKIYILYNETFSEFSLIRLTAYFFFTNSPMIFPGML